MIEQGSDILILDLNRVLLIYEMSLFSNIQTPTRDQEVFVTLFCANASMKF